MNPVRATIPMVLVAAACSPATDSASVYWEEVELRNLLRDSPVLDVPSLTIIDRCPFLPSGLPPNGRQWVEEICVWEGIVADQGNSEFTAGDTFSGIRPCNERGVFSSFCGFGISPPLEAGCAEAIVVACTAEQHVLDHDTALEIVRGTPAPMPEEVPIEYFLADDADDGPDCAESESGCP